MSKLSKILENKKEIGFCSRVIKVQGKDENENKDKGQKTKMWLDYFNDIVSDDLKVLINIENRLKVNKYLNLKKNIELSKLIKKKNFNVLFGNPFDFNLEKFFQNQKKNTNLKIKRSISSCESRKKNTISFDDLMWNNKLKKYINLNELQLISNIQTHSKNYDRNKSCLNSYDRKLNFEKDIHDIQTEQIHSNQIKYNNIKLKNPKFGNKNEYERNISCFLMKSNANKSENNFIKKKKKSEFNLDKNEIISESYDISGIEERIKNEILAHSEYIKNKIMRQTHEKFLLIQDEKSGKVKIVANRKIEIGEVIFIEEYLLETSIMFNDLWNTFNNLDDEQKKKLDEISQLMNMERIYKRKKSESILKHMCDIHNNTSYCTNERDINLNLKNENYSEDYYKKNLIKYKECYKNVTQDNFFKSKEYSENNDVKNRNGEFSNDSFINNLIKFEIFTDILKNSFISCSNRNKVVLFKNASFLNHSCFPNASHCFIDNNKICLLAMRTINMYDEITISFINELYSSIEYRKRKLKDIKSMSCSCNRCLQIIDEERNILCGVCKYSYVSKKLDEEYIRIMEKEKENPTREQNINKIAHIKVFDVTKKKSNDFISNINNELNNLECLNKNYHIKNTINKSVNDHTILNKDIFINSCKDPTHKYIMYENLNSNNKFHNKSNNSNQGYENINDNTSTTNYEKMKNPQFKRFSESCFDSNTSKGLNGLQGICGYNNMTKNNIYREKINEKNTENLVNDYNTRNFFFSQFNDSTNEIENYTNKNNEVEEKKNCDKIFNCLNSTLSLRNNFKNPLYSSIKKKNSYDKVKSEEYLINKGINEKLLHISILERNANLDTNLVNILSIKSVREKIGYCKFHISGKWVCDTCNDITLNYGVPLDSESSFIKEYKIIKEKINSNMFDIESVINNIEKSLLYIVGILGEKHWLYASFNYIVADLCFSLYNFNSLNKKYLLKSFNSFHNFLNFIQIKCPQAVYTDLVPLVLKFLIICIYTSNYKLFCEFANSGFLELIKHKYGSWDVSYISLLYSFRICSEKINNVLKSRKALLTLAELAKINMQRNHFY
ncbi:SET domain protein, putative [Plasmodium relictum]|uniref:SET domain protein, putative n=1 Tax=Plasmodium relictum TaxID=85471 RepID=A0A1J1H7A5_PLARL|nr:SET domain protein, putative [Plasmodium relictum]CRG99310.1 SET domain protein, putative [Plasmodium relictum]